MAWGRHAVRAGGAGIAFLLMGFVGAAAGSSYVPGLWVGAEHALLRLSAKDGTILARIDAGAHRPVVLATDPITGALWVLSRHELREFDRAGNLLRDIELSHHFRGDRQRAALAVDDVGGIVWLAGLRDLYRFDLGGRFLGTVRLHPWSASQAMALDTETSRLWVATGDRLQAYDTTGKAAGEIVLAGRGPIKALAYSRQLASLWVVQRDDLYRYAVSGGNLAARVELSRTADDLLATDGSGAIWAGGGHTLVRIDGSGAIDFVLRHIPGLRGQLVALVADPADHSVWAASERALVHVDADGNVLQRMAPDDQHGWDAHGRGRHHRGREPIGAVRAATLWADVTPPALSFAAPAEAAYVATTTPPLVFHYRDRGSGTDLSSLALAVNGRALGITCPEPADTVPAAGTTTCALAAPLSQGGQSLSATVKDFAGNVSQPATRSFTVDTIPPTITITQPGGRYTNQPHLNMEGHLSEAGTLTVGGTLVGVGADFTFGDPLDLAEGDNTVTLVATDLAGNTVSENEVITLDTTPPPAPNLGLISISGPDADGQVTIAGKAGAVEGGDAVTFTDTRTGQSVTVVANADGSFTAKIAAQASDQLTLTATDEAGNTTSAPHPIDVSNLPPDPSQVAPTVSATGTTPFGAQVSFLYGESNAIQRGVQAGVIVPQRVVVIRGQVEDRAGNPLPGATVAVQGHPEFGHTLSRADGRYDLAANGGGEVILIFSKKGYLSAQRRVRTPWRDYVWADDVALVKPDPNETTLMFGASVPGQLASGSTETDAAGTRTARVFIPAGTEVTLVTGGGTSQPLSTLHLHLTEFTVGPNGQAAMPAELPPASAYTYALEFTADEEPDPATDSIQFNQSVYAYVDNFLGFPVGTHVPSGYYDEDSGEWIGTHDGRVIKVLGVATQGEAELDVDNSGSIAGTAVLADLGFTAAELTKIAQLYPPGKSFWRVPLAHFSKDDFNAKRDVPALGTLSKGRATANGDCHDKVKGCILSTLSQAVGERIPIVGTPFMLNYSSKRAPGYALSRTVDIPLTGSSLPSGIEAVKLTVEVAGQRFEKTFAPTMNQDYLFTWNGEDAYGRRMLESETATISVGYKVPLRYVLVHTGDISFALGGSDGSAVIARRTDQSAIFTKHYTVPMAPSSESFSDGLGGWTLSGHLTRIGSQLYYGGGGHRQVGGGVGAVLEPFVGPVGCSTTPPVNGTPRLQAKFGCNNPIDGLAVGPDGSVYVADASFDMVFRIAPDGKVYRFAGTGPVSCGGPCQDVGDGGPAAQAKLQLRDGYGGNALAVGPDGSVYIADTTDNRVRRVTPDGTIGTIARIQFPTGVVASSDGSLYVMDYSNEFLAGQTYEYPIYQIGTNGESHRFIGTLNEKSMAIGTDGSFYVAENSVAAGINCPYTSQQIYKYSPSGAVSVAAIGDNCGTIESGALVNDWWPAMLAVGPDGSLYVADRANYQVVRIASDGTIQRIAGGHGYCLYYSVADCPRLFGEPAAAVPFPSAPTSIAIGPDGSLYIASGGAILTLDRKVGRPTPDASQWVTSRDGKMLYEFDAGGRELEAVDAATGGTVYDFGYDGAGRLVTITDANGRVTRIERAGDGAPTAIVAPDGQTTRVALDGSGNLTTVTDPAGDAWHMAYDAGGLVSSFEDPNGHTEMYSYGDLGQLTQEHNAAGGGWLLAGTFMADGGRSTTATSALGRTLTPSVTYAPDGSRVDKTVEENGTTTQTVTKPNGETITTAADGTITDTREGADPRFGVQAPLIKQLTVTTPSGLSLQTSESRHATLAGTSLLDFDYLEDDLTLNGRTYKEHFAPGTRTWTARSPAGRTVTTVVDQQDRPVTVKAPALATVAYAYDAQGRLASVGSGSGSTARTVDFAYYPSGPAKGRLQSVTDPLGRATSYAYDPAGRVTAETLPDGQVIGFGYDAAGNLTSVTPPARPAHGMGYTPIDQFASYAPPAASGAAPDAVHYSYNLDRQLTGIALPSGRSVGLEYDGGGQLTGMNLPSGQYQYGYDAITGQLTSLIAGPDNESLGFAWDGFLPTETAWTGPVSGTVAAAYDNYFRVTALAVDGKNLAYGYDADGLLTQAGSLAIHRAAASGFLTGTTLGSVTTSRSYDRFGETTSFAAAARTSARYSVAYTYDKDGEITAKDETVGGISTSWSYGYDQNGRLVSVTQDGATTTYGYDANGNRISVNGATVATYNARDQLLTYGGNTYTWNADGELATKTAPAGVTHYAWNALGELTDVTLPDGTAIHYIYDGMGRRVGKEKNGTLVAGYLYAGSQVVAETDASGKVVERFVYATKPNVPAYMIKYNADGTTSTYRIVFDQVGSVREVIDTSTGMAVQQIDYDVWGNITSDTSPGFQPFAFAGGLYDAETGLVHFGARDYDPETGRWISRDPILFAGGDPNLYRYVVDDPLSSMDPTGYFSLRQFDQLLLGGLQLAGGVGGIIGGAAIAVGGVAIAVLGSPTLVAVPVGLGVAIFGVATIKANLLTTFAGIENMKNSLRCNTESAVTARDVAKQASIPEMEYKIIEILSLSNALGGGPIRTLIKKTVATSLQRSVDEENGFHCSCGT